MIEEWKVENQKTGQIFLELHQIGPANSPTFTFQLTVNGVAVRGEASTKKLAKEKFVPFAPAPE